MRQIATIFFKASFLPLLGVLVLSGCSQIHTVPLPSSNVTLTPNPPMIYVAPFRIDHTQWFAGDDRMLSSPLGGSGFDFADFKINFQNDFRRTLEKHLMKLAPTEERWVDDLPDHGWLVTGDLVVVDQGSRALRSLIGLGNGQTTLITDVYVYDLDRSKTQYVLAFRTGFPDKDGEGMGSGAMYPAGITSLPVPGATPTMSLIQFGSGLKLDTTMTCRAIRNELAQFFNPPIDVQKLH